MSGEDDGEGCVAEHEVLGLKLDNRENKFALIGISCVLVSERGDVGCSILFATDYAVWIIDVEVTFLQIEASEVGEVCKGGRWVASK